jgi:hypothetical protein
MLWVQPVLREPRVLQVLQVLLVLLDPLGLLDL